MTDKTRCLQELEGDDWGEPQFDSYLVKTCHRLRRKPISDFTVEDVRIMVGQRIGLQHLVPLAVEILEVNPFAEGDFYPGDLMKAAIRGPPDGFWNEHRDLARRLVGVLAVATKRLSEMEEADRRNLDDSLKEVSLQIEKLKEAANQPSEGTR